MPATYRTFSRCANLLSATATADEVEPVIRMILFWLMKVWTSCSAWLGLAAESAESSFTFLPSTPLFTFGAIFFISSWLVLMCSTASSQPLSSSSPCAAYVPVSGTEAPMYTVSPCEPAGHVPIAGSPAAQARWANPIGSARPPATPRPVRMNPRRLLLYELDLRSRIPTSCKWDTDEDLPQPGAALGCRQVYLHRESPH